MPSLIPMSQRLRVGVLLLLLVVSTVVAQSPRVDDSISQSLGQHPHTFVPLTATFSSLPSKPSATPILSSTWQSPHGTPASRSSLPLTTTAVVISPDPTPGLLPPLHGPETYEPLTQEEETSDRLLNLYFLLLGVGVVAAFAVVWVLRRRRKSKGERAVQRGRVALRRDLEAGGWRMGVGRWGGGGAGGWRVREEGLDERGEAPPPYHAPPGGGGDGAEGESVEEGYPLPRIPERVATTTRPSELREAVGVGLPRYDDVVDIPRASGNGNGNDNGGNEVVSTPPAVGTELPAVHVTAPSPVQRS